MVTGDHASTAARSASATTWAESAITSFSTGSELEKLNDVDLQKRAADIDIAARATPGT